MSILLYISLVKVEALKFHVIKSLNFDRAYKSNFTNKQSLMVEFVIHGNKSSKFLILYSTIRGQKNLGKEQMSSYKESNSLYVPLFILNELLTLLNTIFTYFVGNCVNYIRILSQGCTYFLMDPKLGN